MVSALEGVREEVDLRWIGWSGAAPAQRTEAVDEAERAAVRGAARAAGFDCRPVLLDASEVDGSYRGFSNASLWPLLHANPAGFRYRSAWWDAYAEANARFADEVVDAAAPGDRVWVHDYHLMLLPEMLRRRRPDLRVGFFLHTPFPPAEVFARHPRREELLSGVLGADLVGFQTRGHLRHFKEAVRQMGGHRCGSAGSAGAESDGAGNAAASTPAGVFPIGIHLRGFERGLADPATAAHAERIAAMHAGARLVLSVERLDPTKGLPQKLDAIERFLENHPEQRESVVFLLIAVPSRGEAPEYQRLREEVERRVGHINGTHGVVGHAPVHCLHRGVAFHELCALYRMADVCLVTPLADGMNLVAKEYLACQPEGGTGVLVLSEFAGAAEELRSASRVNPHDTDAVADAIAEALDRPEAARREALAPLREHARAHHAGPWADGFLAALDAAAGRRRSSSVEVLTDADLAPLAACAPGRKALFLDYDGTLRGFVDDPELATPEPPLRRVLRTLSGREDLDVFIVSGRELAFLRRHLGGHGFTLVGEHGHAFCGPEADAEPQRLPGGEEPGTGWMPGVKAVLERFARSTPGSHVEEKTAGLVWHHRRVEPGLGRRRALELIRLLETAAAAATTTTATGRPLTVTHGKRIVEVTSGHIDKGVAVDHFLRAAEAAGEPYAAALCVGDDRTDEAMFRGRRDDPRTLTVKVGSGETDARFRVADTARVLAVLRAIAGELVRPVGSDRVARAVRTARAVGTVGTV